MKMKPEKERGEGRSRRDLEDTFRGARSGGPRDGARLQRQVSGRRGSPLYMVPPTGRINPFPAQRHLHASFGVPRWPGRSADTSDYRRLQDEKDRGCRVGGPNDGAVGVARDDSRVKSDAANG
jgi:hypothetical protein